MYYQEKCNNKKTSAGIKREEMSPIINMLVDTHFKLIIRMEQKR